MGLRICISNSFLDDADAVHGGTYFKKHSFMANQAALESSSWKVCSIYLKKSPFLAGGHNCSVL